MDDVALEHRLTKIEASQTKQGETLDRIESLIQQQNSKVATHMAHDEAWMDNHDRLHAQVVADKSYESGLEEGRRQERDERTTKLSLDWTRRDVQVAALGFLIAVAYFVSDALGLA